jgi:WD40 repeat protein
MKGHQNTINCCQFNSDGSSLITASDDGTVKVWFTDCDFSNGALLSPRPRSGSDYPHFFNGSCDCDDSLYTYREHLNSESNDSQIEVKCCTFSHNSKLVVSGGSDLNPRVWSFDKKKTKHVLKGHKHTVQSCQFSNNSELIITSSGNEVIVWCAKRAQVLKTLEHEKVVGNCLFSGDLNYIFTSSGRYVYKWSSSGSNKPLNLYNSLKTKYYVTCCAVSPNGQYIAGGTTTDQIIIWSNHALSRAAVATFKGSDQITCINFNNDSTQLLSCSDDGTVIIWDTSKVSHFRVIFITSPLNSIN